MGREVTLLSGHEALARCGDRHYNSQLVPWLGPTMRPLEGLPASPEPWGRGFVCRAHQTHEEKKATQARRRIANWQREMAQTPPAAEAPSGEESDVESEAGGHNNDRAPPSTVWRPHPSVFDTRNNPPFGLPAWPYAPYDHPPYGYTQEAAQQARAFAATYGQHWQPNPFADDLSFWSPHGEHRWHIRPRPWVRQGIPQEPRGQY